MMKEIKQLIENGETTLGIEFGSTRIKAVLIDPQGKILAVGIHNWENRFEDGFWTYSEQDIWQGLQATYLDLKNKVQTEYHLILQNVKAIGISAMMHGYLPFDKSGNLLTPFRTWRNNTTEQAANILTEQFNYNIPQRWSIAHLYQSILNNEPYIKQLDFITTLAGYVHWKLTGEKVLGIGDASGMFPIDISTSNYHTKLLDTFERLISPYQFPWKIRSILPNVLTAGSPAGILTKEGAKLLDPSGQLQTGIFFCPAEGDAGTGMVATNSIEAKTGNISAGTSAFAMVVLDKELSKVYKDIDLVTTPSGKLVAMAHSNNCTSDLNAWLNLFSQSLSAFGVEHSIDHLYEVLLTKSLEGNVACGNLISYGFLSGEHSVGLSQGCPIFIHPTNSEFNLANFIRVHLYSAFGAMKLGMDILTKQENVEITLLLAHGGIFKTKGIAQQVLASALNIPVALMETASEGGAWGIALLANYLDKAKSGLSLEEYLSQHIFLENTISISKPNKEEHEGYEQFIQQYKKGIAVVQQAISSGF